MTIASLINHTNNNQKQSETTQHLHKKGGEHEARQKVAIQYKSCGQDMAASLDRHHVTTTS